jgi:hypothetical protein
MERFPVSVAERLGYYVYKVIHRILSVTISSQ